MANSDSGAVLRADLNTLVEEAAKTDDLFIGEKVMPPFPSNVRAGQYPKFRLGKGELLNDDVLARADVGSYNQVSRTYETDTFTTKDYGLEEIVGDLYREDISRFFDAESIAAKQVLRQLMISHEGRVAAQIMSTDNFTATAAAVNYTEANIATINFPKDVMDAYDRLVAKGCRPNAIICSNSLINRIKRSTLFQNFVRGNLPSGQPVTLMNSDVVRAFSDQGISNFLIGAMPKNSAKKGAAFSSTPIWGNTYIWVGYIAGGDPMAGGAGRTIVWNKEGGLWVTESYRDEKRRGDVIRVRHNTSEKIIDGTAGELITTSYS